MNNRLALLLTRAVGTMWAAYVFAGLAFVALPAALGIALFPAATLTFVQWLSQTFIQLVMLSVIMVGQNIMARADDAREEQQFKDVELILSETDKIYALILEMQNGR